MAINPFNSFLRTGRSFTTIVRVVVVSCALVFVSFGAAPRLGAGDVPELPKGDGTGDVPDMLIKLVPHSVTPASSRQDNVKLSSLRGKVVLLDMFLAECPHCQEHAPHVAEFYNQYRQRGFTVLGLSADRPDKVDAVKTYIRNGKVGFPVGFITTEVVAYYTEGTSVPQMMLFGTDGKLVKRLTGWNPQIAQELKTAIETQLGKAPTIKPGSKASSKPAARKVKQV